MIYIYIDHNMNINNMLVKNIGYALIIKSKLYRIFYPIAPIIMLIIPLVLLYFLPLINQKYQFQEPILKTKIFSLSYLPHQSGANYLKNQLRDVGEGLKMAVIRGRIPYQSIVLASPDCYPHPQLYSDGIFQPFEQVYYNLKRVHKRENKIAKNIIFLCYRKMEDLQQIFYNSTAPDSQNFVLMSQIGIIRMGVIVGNLQTHLIRQTGKQLNKNKQQSQQYQKNENNHNARLFFQRYTSNGLYADVDFYQAFKELFSHQQQYFKWSPCRHGLPALSIPGLESESRKANREIKKWGQLFVREIYCQAKTIITQQRSPHQIFINNGVQAASLFLSGQWEHKNGTGVQAKSSFQALSSVLYSFAQEFSVTESHLHSSSTIYYPLNQGQFIPIKAHLIPGLTHLLIAAIFLVIKAVYFFDNQNKKMLLSQDSNPRNSLNILSYFSKCPKICIILISIYLSVMELYILGTLFYSFWSSFALRLLYTIFLSSFYEKTPRKNTLLQIILSGFSIMLTLYYSIFCLPLSILTCFITNMIALLQPSTLRRILITCFIVFIIYSASIKNQQISQLQINLSNQFYIMSYPLFLWISL